MNGNTIPAVFKYLFGFNGISIVGNAISDVAIPWLILTMTGDPLYVSVIMAIKILPQLWGGLVGGKLIDRWGCLPVSVFSDAINVIAVMLIPIFYTLTGMNFYVMLILVLLSASLDVPGRTAKDVLIAREIAARHIANEKINGWNSTVENIGDLIGPPLAGLLIAVLGVINVFYVDAVSFLIPCVGLLVLSKYLHLKSFISTEKITDLNKPLSLREGLHYLVSTKPLFSLLILSAVINAVVSPTLVVYLPYLMKTQFASPVHYGFVLLCFGLGTVLSSLSYAYVSSLIPYQRLLMGGAIFLGAAFLGLSMAHSVMLIALIVFIMGLSIGFCGPVDSTVLQKSVDENLQGTIFSLFSTLRFLPVPFSMLLFGVGLSGGFQAAFGMVLCGIIMGAAAVFFFMK